MEHDAFACQQPTCEKETCSKEKLNIKSGCARSFYVKEKSKQFISASVALTSGSSLSFQARQTHNMWLIGAAQTCAIVSGPKLRLLVLAATDRRSYVQKEYRPSVPDMKAVVFLSEGVHTWSSARVYLDTAYLGFSRSWQCDYDDHLLPSTPDFELREDGKVWQIRDISFQQR